MTSIRKSARLNKTSTPLAVEIDFLDDESYHGDFEDNDDPRKIGIEEIDDESYHGDSEDNKNLEEEILEDIVQPPENKLQLVLYRSVKSNDMNLSKDKLRLVQEFIRHLEVFYRFTRDSTIAHLLHIIYEFFTTNDLRSLIRTLPFDLTFFFSISIVQKRIAYSLNSKEMDCP